MQCLFHSHELSDDSGVNYAPLFACLWLLEPLCAGRPEQKQEYIQRRMSLLDQTNSTDGLCSDQYLKFAHKIYHAWTYGHSKEMESLLTLPEASMQEGSLYWPMAFARTLLPRMRHKVSNVLRRAYVQIPLRSHLVAMVRPDENVESSQVPRNQKTIEWLEDALLMPLHEKEHIKSVRLLVSIGAMIGSNVWEDIVGFVSPRIIGNAEAYALKWKI